MNAVEDIERAVAELGPSELARFRAWFEAFEAAHFDARIEADAASGRLDGFAEEAAGDLRKGRAREL